MTLPAWASWAAEGSPSDYTLGVEEEIMLLVPEAWSLAHEIDRVLPALEPELGAHVTAETHKSALQLDQLLEACLPHARALGCAEELSAVRLLADGTGAARQLELARGEEGLPGVVAALASVFTSRAAPGVESEVAVGIEQPVS